MVKWTLTTPCFRLAAVTKLMPLYYTVVHHCKVAIYGNEEEIVELRAAFLLAIDATPADSPIICAREILVLINWKRGIGCGLKLCASIRKLRASENTEGQKWGYPNADISPWGLVWKEASTFFWNYKEN